MSDIFENAITSIQLGIEDFQSADPRRHVSALRNFYAGVLLLGKQCLLNAAPDGTDPMEVLASKFKPILNSDGDISYQPRGQQTIDLAELQDRFKGFDLDWPPGDVRALQKLRNEFEHYHSNAPKQAIRQAIADCFPLVEGFFSTLGKSPKAELGDTWDVMLGERAFFRTLKDECNASFAKIGWWSDITNADSIECTHCGSSLVHQADSSNSSPGEIEGRCKACGETFSAEKTVEMLVEAEFGVDDYLAAKDGAEPFIFDCPECSNATYVHAPMGPKCFFCDHTIQGECARCGTSLGISNVSIDSDDLCDYCGYMVSKDD